MYRTKTILFLTACLSFGLAISLIGCARERMADRVTIASEPWALDGSISVKVNNPAGAVTVVVKPTARLEVRIREINGPVGVRPPAGTLGSARWEPANDKQGTLLVGTVSTPDRPVHVSIVTPSCENLEIQSADGPVVVRGANCPITIVNGGSNSVVRITSPRALSGPLNVDSERGDIFIEAPWNSTGRLTCSTPAGRSELNSQGSELGSVKTERAAFGAIINGGETAWNLASREGSIFINLRPEIPDLTWSDVSPW
jgi:hypothetical protein